MAVAVVVTTSSVASRVYEIINLAEEDARFVCMRVCVFVYNRAARSGAVYANFINFFLLVWVQFKRTQAHTRTRKYKPGGPSFIFIHKLCDITH